MGKIDQLPTKTKALLHDADELKQLESRYPEVVSAFRERIVGLVEVVAARPRLPDPRPELTEEQRRVVFLVGRGDTLEKAAVSCGVHPERMRRWLATPCFLRALYLEGERPMELQQISGAWDKEDEDDAE